MDKQTNMSILVLVFSYANAFWSLQDYKTGTESLVLMYSMWLNIYGCISISSCCLPMRHNTDISINKLVFPILNMDLSDHSIHISCNFGYISLIFILYLPFSCFIFLVKYALNTSTLKFHTSEKYMLQNYSTIWFRDILR